MIKNVRIVVLVDDVPGETGLPAEHGLSLWIEADDRRILFDTGQSDLLLRNAGALGIDLGRADAVVLSHGHYDHTGGLAAVLNLNPAAAVYCHPDAVVPRYSVRSDGSCHEIGMPGASASALFQSGRICWVTEPRKIGESIWLTGPVPRLTGFEDTGGCFFLDPVASRPDPIEDDMSMWIETPGGMVAIAGCCHSGIVNTVRHIERTRPGVGIRAIIGGLHLVHASAHRIEETVAVLNGLSLERIVPCHCTGDDATNAIMTKAGDIGTRGTVGMSIDCMESSRELN